MGVYSSSECNKLLRMLNDEKSSILDNEILVKSFSYCDGEEKDIPEYSFCETQNKILQIENKIISIKHAVNVFNTTHILTELGMTIDSALVRMAMLNSTKSKLCNMKSGTARSRNTVGYSGVVQFTEKNYDISDAVKHYNDVAETINKIQLAIDYANLTEKFEIAI